MLITGICDSGKTTILSQLVSGKTGQTYTSMNHNRFSLPVDNKAAVELVDVPGSDRVRGQVILQIPDQVINELNIPRLLMSSVAPLVPSCLWWTATPCQSRCGTWPSISTSSSPTRISTATGAATGNIGGRALFFYSAFVVTFNTKSS